MSLTSGVQDENGNIAPHCFQIGGDNGRPDRRQTAQQPAAPPVEVAAVEATKSVPAAQKPTLPRADILSAKQLLSQLRARLRVVEREIKARKTLERERDQILRLMAAAEQERDNVRSLRAAR